MTSPWIVDRCIAASIEETVISRHETRRKFPERWRIFLSQAKLQHATLLQSQLGHQLGVMECLLASSQATQAAADEQLTFNNAKISFNSFQEGTLDFLAFKTNRMGKERSSEAEGQAISRAWQRISDAIFSIGSNYSQQSLALHHTLLLSYIQILEVLPLQRAFTRTRIKPCALDGNNWRRCWLLPCLRQSKRVGSTLTKLPLLRLDMTSEEAAVLRTHLPVRQNLPNLIQLLLWRRELLLWMPNIWIWCLGANAGTLHSVISSNESAIATGCASKSNPGSRIGK